MKKDEKEKSAVKDKQNKVLPAKKNHFKKLIKHQNRKRNSTKQSLIPVHTVFLLQHLIKKLLMQMKATKNARQLYFGGIKKNQFSGTHS